MNVPLVIGLRGLAGAGKTEIANQLATILSAHGVPARQYSMAGPLKEGLRTMGIVKQLHPTHYRRYAQLIGGEMRAVDPNYWVKQAMLQVKWDGVAIFDDIRYPNESVECDFLYFIQPVGFGLLDLGAGADHESETWNKAYHPHLPVCREDARTTTILNKNAHQYDAAMEILWTLPKSWRELHLPNLRSPQPS